MLLRANLQDWAIAMMLGVTDSLQHIVTEETKIRQIKNLLLRGLLMIATFNKGGSVLGSICIYFLRADVDNW